MTEQLGQERQGESELIVAGLVIVPQVVTAAIAAWLARRADDWGRKPLLLAAFAALALRVGLFTVAPGPYWLLPMQVLSGLDAAAIGILGPLIIADVTAGSGRYNLAQGAVGMATGIGAALSTTAAGFTAQWLGFTAACSRCALLRRPGSGSCSCCSGKARTRLRLDERPRAVGI